mmetsp:Transcript_29841/g.86650  ORF Transcript_29841/g.86650 Transcript_29841/m.86650 type:complete len:243 (+) Transcript_29841:699-1427(+)
MHDLRPLGVQIPQAVQDAPRCVREEDTGEGTELLQHKFQRAAGDEFRKDAERAPCRCATQIAHKVWMAEGTERFDVGLQRERPIGAALVHDLSDCAQLAAVEVKSPVHRAEAALADLLPPAPIRWLSFGVARVRAHHAMWSAAPMSDLHGRFIVGRCRSARGGRLLNAHGSRAPGLRPVRPHWLRRGRAAPGRSNRRLLVRGHVGARRRGARGGMLGLRLPGRLREELTQGVDRQPLRADSL